MIVQLQEDINLSQSFRFIKLFIRCVPIPCYYPCSPPALVSFSIVHQIPNTNILSQAKYICGSIGYATYELPGSDLPGKRISAEFKKGFMAIIMVTHGTLIGGSRMG